MREIAFDTAPGETRAIIFENEKPAELHIWRSHHRPIGGVYDARISARAPAHDYARLNNGDEIILPKALGQHEGTIHRVKIVRQQICEPGKLKLAVAAPSDDALTDHNQLAALWQEALAARCNRTIDLPADFDDHFDIALAGRSELGGATIWFERTKAGLIFDVDGIGDALAHNRVAAAEIARLLRLFQIGGAAMIDFISMENKGCRLAVADAFDSASADDLRRFERTSINGYGLMQVIRPKPGPSIVDTLFGTRRVSLSDETLLLALLRAASRTRGAGVRRCITTPTLAAQLESPMWVPLIAQAARQAGASLEIVADAAAHGYGYIHVAQA